VRIQKGTSQKKDDCTKYNRKHQTRKHLKMAQAMGTSREMGMSGRGGHLFMQTNEIRNSVIHYHRLANGTLTEVERVATGGAGSGTYKPISGQESAPNAFEGAGSVVLSPVSSPCDGRDEAKLQSAAAAEIGGTSGKVRVLAGDISSPATGAALVESAERHFGGLDKFDSGTRWPSFTTQGGGR
jgi:hypothetical protein